MRITYNQENRIWIAESSYSEKDAVKQAGFWWHPQVGSCKFAGCKACQAGLTGKWWTFKPEAAVKLIKYCTPEAREALEGHIRSIEGSKAADAEIVVPAPEGCEYLPFQKAGIAYAVERSGTLISDEMGTGKSIEALGVANYKHCKSILVICPASLKLNWQREARKWLVEDLKIVVVDKNNEDISNADMIIINYERIKGEMFNQLMKRRYDLLIADEVHYCKSSKSQRSRVVLGYYDRELKTKVAGLIDQAKIKLLLTGTPLLNRPVEIQPLAGALNPQFSNFLTFGKRYCGAFQGKHGWDFSGASNLNELQERLRATVMLRRLKKDVLKELPPKTRTIVLLEPNGMSDILADEEKEWGNQALDFDFGQARADADLAAASGDNEAYNAAVRKLDTGMKIAFDEMSAYRHRLAVAKIPAVIEHCKTILDGGVDKLVIFGHHKDVIAALAEHYKECCVVLDGSTPNKERQDVVDKFQNDPTCKVFIGSIHAAGQGITLTAASHVVFAELDWVPAWISQAEDRCHRIGAVDNVTIQHLVVDGSLDARLAETLVWKQEIIERALDKQAPEIAGAEGAASQQSLPMPKAYPQATQDQRDACIEALVTLSTQCDGALKQDGTGFNKLDSRTGKSIAAKSLTRQLTDGEVGLCKKMLPKYHAQLGEELIKRIKGYLNDPLSRVKLVVYYDKKMLPK